MKSVHSILDEFSQMGAKHYFVLKSGRECEGWIVEVVSDGIIFVEGDINAPRWDAKLRLGAVDLTTLSYWDEERECWVEALWDETQNTWLFHANPSAQMLAEARQHATQPPLRRVLHRFRSVLQPPSRKKIGMQSLTAK
jgi:hypothetical protein